MDSDTRPPGADPVGTGPAGPSDAGAEGPATLGGRPRAIRFPPFWHAWFSRQTETRLAALDEIVDAHLERRVMRDLVRRLKHAVVVAFLAAAATAHWFSDQVAWLAERLPVLVHVWHIIVGGR